MKISEKGLTFIISEEGERLTAYKCPAGVWTIGIGHTGRDVTPDLKITKEKSRELLRCDLDRFESTVNQYVKVPLTQNQFDALVSFTFNVGCNAFKNSTLLKRINSKSGIEEIECQFRRWVYGCGKKLPVLVARREREIKLFKGEF